jgi:hypothetical protein
MPLATLGAGEVLAFDQQSGNPRLLAQNILAHDFTVADGFVWWTRKITERLRRASCA